MSRNVITFEKMHIQFRTQIIEFAISKNSLKASNLLVVVPMTLVGNVISWRITFRWSCVLRPGVDTAMRGVAACGTRGRGLRSVLAITVSSSTMSSRICTVNTLKTKYTMKHTMKHTFCYHKANNIIRLSSAALLHLIDIVCNACCELFIAL